MQISKTYYKKVKINNEYRKNSTIFKMTLTVLYAKTTYDYAAHHNLNIKNIAAILLIKNITVNKGSISKQLKHKNTSFHQ